MNNFKYPETIFILQKKRIHLKKKITQVALGFSFVLALVEKENKKAVYSWGQSDCGAHGHKVILLTTIYKLIVHCINDPIVFYPIDRILRKT